MGIYILAALWIWITVGLLYGILSYTRKKDFRAAINESPFLSIILLMIIGFPIALKKIIIPLLINFVGFLLGWQRKNNDPEED